MRLDRRAGLGRLRHHRLIDFRRIGRKFREPLKSLRALTKQHHAIANSNQRQRLSFGHGGAIKNFNRAIAYRAAHKSLGEKFRNQIKNKSVLQSRLAPPQRQAKRAERAHNENGKPATSGRPARCINGIQHNNSYLKVQENEHLILTTTKTNGKESPH